MRARRAMRAWAGRAAVLLALASGGCRSMHASSQSLRTATMERYRAPVDAMTLQPGDKVDIVLHVPEVVNVNEVVDDRGAVTLPYIGEVRISGLTTSKAEELIRSEYIRQKIYREESIQVALVGPVKEFYVQGRVKHAGTFQFSRNLHVLQAVSMAGGRDEFADPGVVRLIRGSTVILLDEKEIRAGRQSDRLVEPGDIIEVPRGWM